MILWECLHSRVLTHINLLSTNRVFFSSPCFLYPYLSYDSVEQQFTHSFWTFAKPYFSLLLGHIHWMDHVSSSMKLRGQQLTCHLFSNLMDEFDLVRDNNRYHRCTISKLDEFGVIRDINKCCGLFSKHMTLCLSCVYLYIFIQSISMNSMWESTNEQHMTCSASLVCTYR